MLEKAYPPAGQQGAEQQPAEQQPAAQQAAEQHAAEQQAAGQQAAEQQPAGQQAAEQQAAEQEEWPWKLGGEDQGGVGGEAELLGQPGVQQPCCGQGGQGVEQGGQGGQPNTEQHGQLDGPQAPSQGTDALMAVLDKAKEATLSAPNKDALMPLVDIIPEFLLDAMNSRPGPRFGSMVKQRTLGQMNRNAMNQPLGCAPKWDRGRGKAKRAGSNPSSTAKMWRTQGPGVRKPKAPPFPPRPQSAAPQACRARKAAAQRQLGGKRKRQVGRPNLQMGCIAPTDVGEGYVIPPSLTQQEQQLVASAIPPAPPMLYSTNLLADAELPIHPNMLLQRCGQQQMLKLLQKQLLPLPLNLECFNGCHH